MQTAAYSKYRLDAADFFDRNGAWSVALAAPDLVSGGVASSTGSATDTTIAGSTGAAATTDFATESSAARFEPYYTMFHAPGSSTTNFDLYRPFQPFSTTDQRKELVAYMTASSDPATYGRLTAYVVAADPANVGPFTVGSAMLADPEIGRAHV